MQKEVAFGNSLHPLAPRVPGSVNENLVTNAFVERPQQMSDRPIDLDGRRTATARIGSKLRRKATNRDAAPDTLPNVADTDKDAALALQSVRTGIEAIERAVFVLRKYAAAKQEADPAIQNLIMRAESELARLRRREAK